MDIEKAKPEQAAWLDEVIKREFPYTKFTPEKIISRINDPKFAVLVARQENIMTGFAEMELFLEAHEARLNGIYIEDAWRDQGIAKMLIAHLINLCKHKRVQKLFLLVKETNEDAKALYTKTGFKFEKIHNKKIEDAKVEVWTQYV